MNLKKLWKKITNKQTTQRPKIKDKGIYLRCPYCNREMFILFDDYYRDIYTWSIDLDREIPEELILRTDIHCDCGHTIDLETTYQITDVDITNE